MPEPADHSAEATSQTESPLKHFIYGAIPFLAAVFAVLWQLLDPYVPLTHQGLLFGIAVFLGNTSLAVWLWCTVQVVERKFTERNRLADAKAERLQNEFYVLADAITENHRTMIELLGKLQRSLQSLHRHMDKQDGIIAGQNAEIAHLRRLILGVDEPQLMNGQQMGPRRLN